MSRHTHTDGLNYVDASMFNYMYNYTWTTSDITRRDWPHPFELWIYLQLIEACIKTYKKPTSYLNWFLRFSWIIIFDHLGQALACLAIATWNDWEICCFYGCLITRKNKIVQLKGAVCCGYQSEQPHSSKTELRFCTKATPFVGLPYHKNNSKNSGFWLVQKFLGHNSTASIFPDIKNQNYFELSFCLISTKINKIFKKLKGRLHFEHFLY